MILECRKRAIEKYEKSHPWIRTLIGIRSRCNNPKAQGYKWYGGRGIKCFITALELKIIWERDMANIMNRPSIDRIDSNGHYESRNCRFIEMNENSARARLQHLKLTQNDVLLIRRMGGKYYQREIAVKFGVSRSHVENILNGTKWGWVI